MFRFGPKVLIVPVAVALAAVAGHVRTDAAATSVAETALIVPQPGQHAQAGQHADSVMLRLHQAHMDGIAEALAAHLGLGADAEPAILEFFDSLHTAMSEAHTGMGAHHGAMSEMHHGMVGHLCAHGTGRGGGG